MKLPQTQSRANALLNQYVMTRCMSLDDRPLYIFNQILSDDGTMEVTYTVNCNQGTCREPKTLGCLKNKYIRFLDQEN